MAGSPSKRNVAMDVEDRWLKIVTGRKELSGPTSAFEYCSRMLLPVVHATV